MASARAIAWVERLVWILIYGGLLTLILGIVAAPVSPATGWAMGVGGCAAAAAGVVLIWVRSRMRLASE